MQQYAKTEAASAVKVYSKKESVRKLRIILLTLTVIIGITVYLLYRPIRGDILMGHMRHESVISVTVTRTVERNGATNEKDNHELTPEELTQFYDLLEASKYRKIYSDVITFPSNIWYVLDFKHVDERINKQMAFCGDKLVFFGYQYSLPAEDYFAYQFDKADASGEYRIVSTDLGSFFEGLF